MIVTNYNEMSLYELLSIYERLEFTFLIEDGKIVKVN